MNSKVPSPVGQAAAREGVAALRARAWLLVLLVVIGAGAGYLLGQDSGSVWRAWIISQSLGANRAVTETGISTPEGPQAADFLDGHVLTRLEKTTGKSYEFLIDHMTLAQPPNGGPNPPVLLVPEVDDLGESKELLLDWLQAIHVIRTTRVQAALARGEAGLRKDLAKFERQDRPVNARELENLLARISTLRSTLTTDYAVFKGPREIPQASSTRGKSAEVGAIAGLIAGVALALVIALLDGRMRTREGLEAASDIELFADLRSAGAVPSGEHARARLLALGGGSMPAPVLCLPCGSIDLGEAQKRVSDALGEGAVIEGGGSEKLRPPRG